MVVATKPFGDAAADMLKMGALTDVFQRTAQVKVGKLVGGQQQGAPAEASGAPGAQQQQQQVGILASGAPTAPPPPPPGTAAFAAAGGMHEAQPAPGAPAAAYMAADTVAGASMPSMALPGFFGIARPAFLGSC